MIIKTIVGYLILLVYALFESTFLGIFFMFLWDFIIPSMFGFKEIFYLHSVGILFMIRIAILNALHFVKNTQIQQPQNKQ